jgi:hypothetical protein
LGILRGRRRSLRAGRGNGLSIRHLDRRLTRPALGLRKALGKTRGLAGPHGGGNRMDLRGVDRLDSHPLGRRVLAAGLGA